MYLVAAKMWKHIFLSHSSHNLEKETVETDEHLCGYKDTLLFFMSLLACVGHVTI